MNPAMRKAIARFLFDDGQPVMVDGSGITPDPELAARNAARIEAARVSLGPRWLCWPKQADEEARQAYENECAAHSWTER